MREKEEAKAALSKFRVGDGVFWEEENRSLKDKNADLKARLAEEREQKEVEKKKADQVLSLSPCLGSCSSSISVPSRAGAPLRNAGSLSVRCDREGTMHICPVTK